MLKKLFKQEKGFTMIELIIVIAIIAIIGAIIAPQFGKSSVKAKLNSDIQSVRTLNDAYALHQAEAGEITADKSKIKDVIDELINDGYLREKTSETPQIKGAVFFIDSSDNLIKLDITKATENKTNLDEAYGNLSEQDKAYVKQS